MLNKKCRRNDMQISILNIAEREIKNTSKSSQFQISIVNLIIQPKFLSFRIIP